MTINKEKLQFKTARTVPKTGVMLVGWGGNNGSTLTAGIMANKQNITWNTKEGECKPNYFGSVTQASTVKIGSDETGRNVYAPLKNLLPMVDPNDLVIGGWDISSMNLADSMRRAEVLDFDLQRNLAPHMEGLVPLPSIYYPDFIAANQSDRADNVLPGSKKDHLVEIRNNIRDFKAANNLDKVLSTLSCQYIYWFSRRWDLYIRLLSCGLRTLRDFPLLRLASTIRLTICCSQLRYYSSTCCNDRTVPNIVCTPRMERLRFPRRLFSRSPVF